MSEERKVPPAQIMQHAADELDRLAWCIDHETEEVCSLEGQVQDGKKDIARMEKQRADLLLWIKECGVTDLPAPRYSRFSRDRAAQQIEFDRRQIQQQGPVA